jgi:arsenate reductase
MAEALLRHDAGDRFIVESAGTRPGSVRPEAVAVLKELGIDMSAHRAKHADEFSGVAFDYVITVCDNAQQSCPVFAAPVTLHRSFDDPPPPSVGTEPERLAIFRRIRDQLRAYLFEFAKDPPSGSCSH